MPQLSNLQEEASRREFTKKLSKALAKTDSVPELIENASVDYTRSNAVTPQLEMGTGQQVMRQSETIQGGLMKIREYSQSKFDKRIELTSDSDAHTGDKNTSKSRQKTVSQLGKANTQ